MISKKGYSLIEIIIGIVIITFFLLTTGSLINASYTNYRLVLQRNEALEYAIDEMEKVLSSDEVEISDLGYTKNNMEARVTIDNVKSGSKTYIDKVFLVTVDVKYSKTANEAKKYNVKLQSLKVVK